MADKVEIVGGDFDGGVLKNAASESTLKRLVAAIEKQSPGKGNKVQDMYNKALEKNIEAVEDATDMHESYEKTLKQVNERSKEFSDTLSGIAKTAVGGIFSGIVATGSMLVDFFKTGFDAFKETNQVGASFNYDLLELRRVASEAAMPIEDFTKFVRENSRELAAFGGTVTEGAKRFAAFREEFTDPSVNKELYNLGFNTESLNKIMAEQLKTEMVSGRSRELNGATFARELKDYTKDLNKLSKVTGVSTETLQAGVTQQLADGRMMYLQNRLTGKALANFREGLALMNAELDPKVFDTLKNMMSGVIDPTDKFGQMLAIASPGILQFQQAIADGSLGVEEQVAGYEKQVGQIERFLGRFSKQQIARMPELKAMQEYLSSIKKFTGDQGKANLESNKAMDGIIGLFSSFGEILNRVKNLFLKAFINTHTMERIQDAFNKLTAFIEQRGPDIIKRLEPVMTEVGNWIDYVVDGLVGFGDAFLRGDLKPENIWNWVKKTFDGAIKVVIDGLNAVVSGLMGTSPEQQAQRLEYDRATPEEKERMRQQNPALAMPDVGGVFDKMGEGLKSLIAMVPSLSDLALFFGVVGGGSFVAGLGLAAGISAVAAAMAELSLPALAVGAAIGMGAGGLGYALNGVANIINSVTDGFTKLGNFFTTLGNMEPTKILNVGNAIKVISGSMTDLSSGGLTALITGGSLESLANTLVKVSQIDPNKLSATGPALKSLYDGLSLFTKEGLMDSIGSSFTNFFSDSTLENVISSLTKFQGIDLSKLSGFGSFAQGVKELGNAQVVSNFSANVSNIDGMIDVIKRFEVIDSSQLMSIGSGIEKLKAIKDLESIDLAKIDNTVSAMGKIKTVFGEGFQSQANEVNNFTKSIDNLVDSMKKLEDQMKRNSNTTNSTVPTDTKDLVNQKTKPTDMSSIINPEELQKQLNTKVDELIAHIKEMKQNTKDTADSLSGRKSAL